MNIGFVESKKLYDWQCMIFHDVDLLPEDDRNLYTCPESPRHMSSAIDIRLYKFVQSIKLYKKFFDLVFLNFRLPYDTFGGVSAVTVNQFILLNGYGNNYWGWGSEDDDMAERLGF